MCTLMKWFFGGFARLAGNAFSELNRQGIYIMYELHGPPFSG